MFTINYLTRNYTRKNWDQKKIKKLCKIKYFAYGRHGYLSKQGVLGCCEAIYFMYLMTGKLNAALLKI